VGSVISHHGGRERLAVKIAWQLSVFWGITGITQLVAAPRAGHHRKAGETSQGAAGSSEGILPQ
jgi:hypothetical protein